MKSWVKMMKGVGVIVALVGVGWYLGTRSSSGSSADLHVAATFFPMADFAKEVGGKGVDVTQIVPDGVEPHDYEPSPEDITNVLSADVVIINGGGVDAWAEKLIPDIEKEGGIVVRISDVVPFINDEHGDVNPHAWLDSARMQEGVRAIAEAYIIKDEAHLTTYATNADNVRAELKALDEKFLQMLASCKSHTIFVTHDAFGYWALRYNLNIESISGITPDAEPSMQDLVNLAEKARERDITTVFFESPASTALATTLAEEIGASVDVLSPLEGRTPEEINQGATYFTIMEKNLDALSRALTCTLP